MNKFFTFIFAAIFSTQFCTAQINPNTKTTNALRKADSVILISHILTDEYAVMSPLSKYNKKPKEIFYPLLVSKDINPKAVLRRALLNKEKLNKLITIISWPITTTDWGHANCDEPHNTILIYRKSKLSYIDICFGCHQIHTSRDLQYNEFGALVMDNKKWSDLEAFFKKLHVNYVAQD